MRVAIDASNLRYGGGITHLIEVLGEATPEAHGVDGVVVWGGRATLDQIPDRPWIERAHDPALDGAFPQRAWWQNAVLPGLVAKHRCDLLFAPGGTAPDSVHPRVVMCQSMLPFDPVERGRYTLSATHARLLVLRQAQGRSFGRSDGVIFLTRYAKNSVCGRLPRTAPHTAIIPHGVNRRFVHAPRAQRPLSDYTHERPFRWVYVSTVARYKHQWVVAEAFRALRAEGLPVAIDFVGLGDDARSVRALVERLRAYDPSGRWSSFAGSIPYASIEEVYHRADAAVYASSCENMPNILLESMASGLPVACSDRGPMPEVIGASAVYFDPERPDDIARAVRAMLRDPGLRARLAQEAFERAQRFSWARCADDTLAFLARVAAGR